jgi:hypothetical protein
MYDRPQIIAGLVIALVILTFPIWYNLPNLFSAPPPPEPELAAQAQAAGYCVMPGAFMRTTHMQILDDWRNAVVRDGHRYVVVSPDQTRRIEMQIIDEMRGRLAGSIVEVPLIGTVRDWVDVADDELLVTVAPSQRKFEMSLQNTCMECHTSKAKFCDACHDYTNVSPFCWDCHVAPEETGQTETAAAEGEQAAGPEAQGE